MVRGAGTAKPGHGGSGACCSASRVCVCLNAQISSPKLERWQSSWNAEKVFYHNVCVQPCSRAPLSLNRRPPANGNDCSLPGAATRAAGRPRSPPARLPRSPPPRPARALRWRRGVGRCARRQPRIAPPATASAAGGRIGWLERRARGFGGNNLRGAPLRAASRAPPPSGRARAYRLYRGCALYVRRVVPGAARGAAARVAGGRALR